MRVFRQFAWLEVGSVKVASSCPTHQRVPYALIALVLGLIAIIALIPARPIAELVTLSDRYATATTDDARNQYLAAGEALLTLFNGTAWIVNLVLASASNLISCLLMLRSNIFSRATAYFEIAISIMIFLFFIPVVGMFLVLLSTAGGVVFPIVVGRRLMQGTYMLTMLAGPVLAGLLIAAFGDGHAALVDRAAPALAGSHRGWPRSAAVR